MHVGKSVIFICIYKFVVNSQVGIIINILLKIMCVVSLAQITIQLYTHSLVHRSKTRDLSTKYNY